MAEELLPAMSVRHGNLYGEVAENTPFRASKRLKACVGKKPLHTAI